MKLNRTLKIRNRHFFAISAAMYLLLMLFSVSKISAQSELGVVWTKEYNDIPKGLYGSASKFIPQPYYFSQTADNKVRYLITGYESHRMGFIAVMDESGNILNYYQIPIPTYYDKYAKETVASRAAKISHSYPDLNDPYTKTVNSLFATGAHDDIVAGRITTAVMRKDGSILAFGFVHRYRSDAWKAPGDTETDYSPGSHANSRMKQGVWKIIISKDGELTVNTTARGAEAYDLFPYGDNYILTGLDIHNSAKIGLDGEGVGMLHEYDPNGNFIGERCPISKDAVPVVGATQFLDGDVLLYGWSGTPAVRANPADRTTIKASYDANRISTAVNYPMNGTPAIDGGGFFNPQFQPGSYYRGASFGKWNPDGTLAYAILNAPNSRDVLYNNPLILDLNRDKYVGTVNKGGVNYIYELTDKKNSCEIIEGDPYPSNASLRAVSLQDGFFAMGQDPTTRKVSVVKLSTCANFKLNGGTSEVSMRTGQPFSTRNITHTGNKGTVTYKWTLTDITTGGNAIEGWSGIVQSGTTNTLPTQTFKLTDGKNFATLQYNIIAVDKYNITGVEQTCQQSHTILIKIYRNLPDNIIIDESDCTINFERIDFAVKQTWSVTDIGQQNTGLLVGDLDGDGIPEIVAFSPDRKKILVRSGVDGSAVTEIAIADNAEVRASNGWYPVITAALVDSDGDGMGEIIIAHPNKKLISYKARKDNDGKLLMEHNWTSATLFEYPVVASTGSNGGLPDNGNQPFVADLNGDGTPEVIIYNKVYNAKTGQFLCNTELLANAYVGRQNARINKNINFFSVGDFDNDGQLEIAAGGKVYKLNFKSDGTVTSSIWAEMANVKDGYTAVADINMDGKLDIIVLTSIAGTHTGKLQVWTPSAGGGTMVSELNIAMPNLYCGFPFIGDLDGDLGAINGVKYPEICFTIQAAVKAYKYVPNASGTGGTLQSKWTLPTEDSSGATGITLFDFNNDGKNEIVYRDQTLLRILDGSKDTTPVVADASGSIECYSGTAYEYPVIADVNGNGAANICVTCSNSYAGSVNYIRLYESKESNWAPTRNVWNQVNYEPTLINGDLTATTLPIAKNTQFAVGNVTHTPYNGTLIQVPITNLNMETVVVAADAYIDKIQATWVDKATGIVQLSVVVGNQGIVNTDKDLPITLYKNSIDPANIVASKKIDAAIRRNTKVVVDFGQFKVDQLSDIYIARVQDDNGTVIDKFLDCKPENNTKTFDGLFLNDDFFIAYLGVETNLNVIANDVLPTGCTNPILTIISGPSNGSAAIDGTIIKYTSDPNFPIQKGKDEPDDEIVYQIQCGSKIETAKVKIKIVPKPDNIDDAHCFVDPVKSEWSMKEAWISSNYNDVVVCRPWLVGDLDGDKLSEIVAVSSKYNEGRTEIYKTVVVFPGGDRNNPVEIKTADYGSYSCITHLGIVVVKNASNQKEGLVVVVGNDGYLYAYSYPSGNFKWKSTQPAIHKPAAQIEQEAPSVAFADFNNDGNPEVYCGNRIFNAATGEFLVSGSATDNVGFSLQNSKINGGVLSVAADINGDGKLELIAGNQAYKVDIAGNDMSVMQTLAIPGYPGKVDGHVSLADFNNDNFVDALINRIVFSHSVGSVHYYNLEMYGWDMRNNKLLFQYKQNGMSSKSIPFIGDIDGDKENEIIVLMQGDDSGNKNAMLKAFKLPKTFGETSVLNDQYWNLNVVEGAARTGITLFDFDQDGMAELVYRDEATLRIIDGRERNNPKDKELAQIISTSATTWEYPIVADIDNDGMAEIVCAGGTTSRAHTGTMRTYKVNLAVEGAKQWAPARPVWNQYAYNAVNVNDDSTIPAYQLNPATTFPGKDGQLGTADDTRPYNAFLMQQTRLNRDGVPLMLTPDALIVNPENIKFDYNIEAKTVKITGLTIKNEGSASLQSPIRISVYKDESSVPDGQKITFDWNKVIAKGESATLTAADNFVINNFYEFLPTNGLQIRINDKGNGLNDQLVCKSCCVTNGSGDFSTSFDAMGTANKYKHCIGGTVALTGADQSVLKGTPVYNWTKPDGVTDPKTGKTVTYNLPSLTDGGHYILTASNIGNNANLSVTYKLPYLSVAPQVMQWKNNTTNNDWNDPNNWNQVNPTTGVVTPIKAVPAECTTVHIPAVATNYPSLSQTAGAGITATDWSLYGQPGVNNIIYHYGAEVAYPHQLQYNKAYIQYNFGYYTTYTAGQPTQNKEPGSPVLKRDVWYPMAAPLKEMVSGDFAFGGYPVTWQAMPDILSSSNNLNSVNFNKYHAKNDQPLAGTNNMIALKAPLWSSAKGSSDQKHIENLKGILEIPFHENDAQAADHPSHSYDPISNVSTYYYYDSQTLQQVGSPVGTQKRKNDNAYRFIFEKDDKTVTNVTINGVSVPCYTMEVTPNASKQVLIGNPFIASINMDHFQKANSTVIEGTTFNAYKSDEKNWKPYTYSASSVNALQAFAITLRTTAKITLNFPLEGNWALTGKAGSKIPRRLETPGAIAVTASNTAGKGGDYAELTAGQEQAVNVSKLISEEGHALPEAFFIDQTGNDYNLIQIYEQGMNEVGLGVKCSDTQNELTLTFDHIEAFSQLNNTHPVLVDKLLGVEQDLTKNSVYRFRQHTTANSQSQYADKKRFAIRFGNASDTGSADDSMQVIYTNSHLEVKTTVTAIAVEVYSLSGQLLFNSGAIATTNYHQDLPLAQGGYIVKVKTNNNKTTSKKIMAL